MRRDLVSSRIDLIHKNFLSFIGPINLGAELMANDDFLIEWLKEEKDRPALEAYLNHYGELIGSDAIDLASTSSEIVYLANGGMTQMNPHEERDKWYYSFQKSQTIKTPNSIMIHLPEHCISTSILKFMMPRIKTWGFWESESAIINFPKFCTLLNMMVLMFTLPIERGKSSSTEIRAGLEILRSTTTLGSFKRKREKREPWTI